MISERLEQARKKLADGSNSRVYVVIEVSPTVMIVLMVPKGAENLPVANPMGAPEADDCSEGDWQRIDAPMMVTIDVDRVRPCKLAAPKLRVVP
jgi:hypothetical protein